MLEDYLPSVVAGVSAFNASCQSASAFVVVADNGSSDGSIAFLQGFPQVRVLPLERNYGYAGGYNRALCQIDADYYVLLNSDVETPEGWLAPLVDFMEEHPDAGICQPKILSFADRSCFEYAGACGGFIDRYGYPFCRGRILSCIERDRGQYDGNLEVFWASGACMMIRSALFHHLGGFDESFFAHMEEIDLCWRTKLLGYQVWCVPSSRVFHLGGGTLPNDSPRKLYLNYRNNLVMLAKNLPERKRRQVLVMRSLLDASSAAIFLITGRWSRFCAVVRARRDFRRHVADASFEPSPFVEQRNDAGLYGGSILVRFFLGRGRCFFSDLKFQ